MLMYYSRDLGDEGAEIMPMVDIWAQAPEVIDRVMHGGEEYDLGCVDPLMIQEMFKVEIKEGECWQYDTILKEWSLLFDLT